MAEEGKVVNKKWGKEFYYTNTDKFCCKELIVNPMSVCSKHRHLVKDEMFRVIMGTGFIEVNDRIYYVTVDDHLHIPHGTWHRFWSVAGMVLLEISTHHDDKDVERDVPSDKIHRVDYELIPEVEWSYPNYYTDPDEVDKDVNRVIKEIKDG